MHGTEAEDSRVLKPKLPFSFTTWILARGGVTYDLDKYDDLITVFVVILT